MEIEWKPVEGYLGYSVSNTGLIKSEKRVVPMKNGRTKTVSERILRPSKAGNGYLRVQLGANKPEYVHRIVANAFLARIDGYSEVNHKDEDKTNNAVSNLEWVTHLENVNYGTRNSRCAVDNIRRMKSVAAYHDGQIAERYSSIREAERAGYCRRGIQLCLNGKRKTYKGFSWELPNELPKGKS